MKIYQLSIVVFLGFLFSGCSSKSFVPEILRYCKREQCKPQNIIAICKKESNLKPYVVNVNKSLFNIQRGPHYFDTWYGANAYMDFVLDPLFLNYDIGMCQINKVHLDRLDIDNEDLLDEDTNIEAAAKIYKWNVKQCRGEVMCALSMYNTGYKNSTVGKAYARKVLRIRKRMFGE